MIVNGGLIKDKLPIDTFDFEERAFIMTCFNCLFEDEAEYEEFYVNILMPDDEISYGNSEHFVKYSIN